MVYSWNRDVLHAVVRIVASWMLDCLHLESGLAGPAVILVSAWCSVDTVDTVDTVD